MRLSLRKGALLIALMSTVFFFVVAEEAATTAASSATTATSSEATAVSSDDKAAADGVLTKVKAMLMNKKNYDLSEANFSALMPTAVINKLEKGVQSLPSLVKDPALSAINSCKEFKIKYNWGFGGSGLEEAKPLEDGFKKAKVDIFPAKFPAVAGIEWDSVFNSLGFGSGIKKPIDLLKRVLSVAKVGSFDPANMIDKLTQMPEDLVMSMKLFFCGAAIKDKFENAKTKEEKQEAAEYAVSQVTFLLARLAYTLSEAKDAAGNKMQYLKAGVGKMFEKLNAVFGDELDTIMNNINVPMPATDVYWYNKRIVGLTAAQKKQLPVTGVPATPLEEALAKVFSAKNEQNEIKGHHGISAQFEKEIVPMITSSLDYFDRKTLVAALEFHIKKINYAIPEDKIDVVFKVRKEAIDKLYTAAVAAMTEAGTFGAGAFPKGVAPKQDNLIAKVKTAYENIGKKPDLGKRISKLADISMPSVIGINIVKAVNILWTKFTLSILKHKFLGDPGFVDKSYLPISPQEAFATAAALGFRITKEITNLIGLGKKQEAAGADWEKTSGDVKARMESLPTNINDALKKYLDIVKQGQLLTQAKAKTKGLFPKDQADKLKNLAAEMPKAMVAFKKAAVHAAFIRDMIKNELILMYRRTTDFAPIQKVMDMFLKPLGTSVDDILQTTVEKADAEKAQAEMEEAKQQEEEAAAAFEDTGFGEESDEAVIDESTDEPSLGEEEIVFEEV